MSRSELLWQDPGRMGGAVCIRGTRLTCDFIADLSDVCSILEICEDYQLVPSQVRAAVKEAQHDERS